MNERIRQLAMSNGIYDCITDPYDKLRNGDDYSSIMIDLERFAELILIEVTDILSTYRSKVVFTDGAEYNYEHPIIAIRKHFGVKS